MEVALIVPDFDFFPPRARDVHFGLGALASVLRARGIQVSVLDLNFVPVAERERSVLSAASASDVVGFTSYTCNHHIAEAYAREVRRYFRDKTIVCGGPHITGLYFGKSAQADALTADFDALFVDECESAFLEYCLGLGRQEKWIVGRPLPSQEVAKLPDVSRAGIDYSQLECARILTSRGCPHKCAMCVNSARYNPLRYRTVDAVLSEMRSLRGRTETFFLVDDAFSSNGDYVLQVCRALLDAKVNVRWTCLMRADGVDADLLRTMKHAGCQRVSIGCESGAHRILDSIRKGISPDIIHAAIRDVKAAGLECRTSWIVGLPEESGETIRATEQLLLAACPDVAVIYQAIPFPGTKLATENKDLVVDGDFRNYYGGSGRVLMRSKYMLAEEIAASMDTVSAVVEAAGIRLDKSFRPLDGR